MKKNKKGFTLGEVLICMVIVGVIMVIAMNAIKIVRASYTSLTYFTFKNLKDMVGVVYSGQTAYTLAAGGKGTYYEYDKNSGKYTLKQKECKIDKNTGSEVCSRDTAIASESSSRVGGYEQLTDSKGVSIPNPTILCKYGKIEDNTYDILSVLKNDSEQEYENKSNNKQRPIGSCTSRPTGTGSNGSIFCKALSGILNSSGPVKCAGGDLYQAGYNGTSKEPYISGSELKSPNFITTNGQRYYLSKWQPPSANVSPKYGYRIIAVDLNGKTGPNKLDKSAIGGNTSDTSKKFNSSPADIVQFLILDNGQVYPLGLAADNKQLAGGKKIQYLTSQIKGYYFDSKNLTADRRDINIPQECKQLKAKDFKRNDNDASFEEDSEGKYTEQEVDACNFGRVDVQNENDVVTSDGKKSSFFTYREAFCAITPSYDLEYENYCKVKSYTKNPLCPPSNSEKSFDECRVVNIKPMFRYNFK